MFSLGAIYNLNLFEMITLTFAAHDHSDPSGFIHVSLLFGLCLVVIGLCLALMAGGQECCRPLSVWRIMTRGQCDLVWMGAAFLLLREATLPGSHSALESVSMWRSSAEAPEEASQAQPGVAAAIGERMMIKSFPWSFAQRCYFKVTAYTGPVQTIVKVK